MTNVLLQRLEVCSGVTDDGAIQQDMIVKCIYHADEGRGQGVGLAVFDILNKWPMHYQAYRPLWSSM